MGQLVTIDDTFMPLPPLQTVIQYGKKGSKTSLPARIEAEYTEMGTLSLWCRCLTSDHRWQLRFQLRDSMPAAAVREEIVLEDTVIEGARQAVLNAFGCTDPHSLNAVVKKVATAVDLPREQWPLRMLRSLADLLLTQAHLRAQSPAHEARWMNLTGFCLRPGFGDVLDAERVRQVWKLYNQGAVHPNQPQVQIEWWILWRRLAGGLLPGQQRQLSQEWGRLWQVKKGKTARLPQQHQLEIWMAVANLERLYVKDKIQWGRLLLSQINPNQAKRQQLWSLARIGARELLYGSNDRVVGPQEVGRWIDALLGQTWPEPTMVGTALAQMARKTGDRSRDIDESVRARILSWLATHAGLTDQGRYLQEVVPMARQEEQALFGESLPVGLILHGQAQNADPEGSAE
jgi:hypothetical protein